MATGDPTILTPMFALAAWTGLMLILVARSRVSATARGHAKTSDFRFGESPGVPGAVSLFNRNYMNLLELPVLFYVACLMAYATQTATPAMAWLAWLYVALRGAHSLVHVTYNNVLHRFAVFGLSNFALIGLWVWIGVALAGRGTG